MGSGTDEYWKMRKKEREMEAVVKKLQEGGSVCFDCPPKYSGKATRGNTCWEDKCCVCGEKKTCCSVTDFIWPKEFKIGYIWD